MKKALGIFFVAVAVFAIVPTVKAQYSPPATLKKQFDETMKKVGTYISDLDSLIKENATNAALQDTRHKDLKDRWDAVENKANQNSKDTIKKIFEYSTAVKATIDNISSDDSNRLKNLKSDKANIENTEATKITSNKDYMNILKTAFQFRSEAASAYKKGTETTEFIRSRKNDLTDALTIIKALEESQCEPSIDVSYPEDLIATFSEMATESQALLSGWGYEMSLASDTTEKLYNDVMMEWYMVLFWNPEAISEEDMAELTACLSDIYSIQQYFEGNANYLEMQDSMWQSMMWMAESYENPWDQVGAYQWLAASAEYEYYYGTDAYILFATERYEQAMAILAKAGM